MSELLVIDKCGPIDQSGCLIIGRAATAGGTIELLVNNRVVSRTHIAKRGKFAGKFVFRCDCIGDYLGDGDVITLRHVEGASNDRFSTKSIECKFPNSSRVPELFCLLDEGYVLTKFGKLHKGWNLKRRKIVQSLFESVKEILERELGVVVIPSAGNLLGAIREQNFIAHDAGAFDTVFVSSYGAPEAVREQCLDAVRVVASAEITSRISVKPSSIFLSSPLNRGVKLDLRWAWFNESEELDFSCGSRFERAIGRNEFFALKLVQIGDWCVEVPGNAEKILHQFYGPNWRTPDQANRTGAKQIRDARYHLSSEDIAAAKQFLERRGYN